MKHVIRGKIEGKLESTGIRGRRRKQLLDDLKETRRHCKWQEDILGCSLWRTRFGSCSETVVRQCYYYYY